MAWTSCGGESPGWWLLPALSTNSSLREWQPICTTLVEALAAVADQVLHLPAQEEFGRVLAARLP